VRVADALHDTGLQRIRILIFVHHDIAEASAYRPLHFRILFEKDQQVDQQIVVVHDVVLLLVRNVGTRESFDFLDLLLELRIVPRNDNFERCDGIDRCRIHFPQRLFLGKAFFIRGEAESVAQQVDHIFGIALIENGKIIRSVRSSSSTPARRIISRDALRVNVSRRIASGRTPCSMSLATL